MWKLSDKKKLILAVCTSAVGIVIAIPIAVGVLPVGLIVLPIILGIVTIGIAFLPLTRSMFY